MSRLPRVLSTVLPALFLIALPRALSSAVIHVPADRPTIAAALATATNGDEIVIACGTYNEHDLVLKPGITLRSATGSPDCVTIDGQQIEVRIMRGTAVHGVSLEGLTFANGGAETYETFPPFRRFRGGGLYLSSSQSVALRNCAFVRNVHSNGAGVWAVNGTHLTLTECSFLSNTAVHGSAISAPSGTLSITGCEFKFSGGGHGGYGFSTMDLRASTTIASSVVSENAGTIMISNGSLLVTDTMFHHNSDGWLHFAPSRMFSFTNCQATFQRCVFDSGAMGISNYASFVVANASLTLESCTLHRERNGLASLISATGASQVNVTNSILSSVEAVAIFSCASGNIEVTCSNLWAPSGLEFSSGCVPDSSGVIRVDPIFCNAGLGDFSLASNSLCLPQSSPCGVLIGAFGEGCGPVSVRPLTWGRIKNLYR